MGKGLIWDETTKKWIVNIANGLSYSIDGKIQVQPADNSIIVDSNGVKANIADGLELTPNGIETKLGNGIAFDGNNALTVKPADNSIIVDANGIKVGQIGVDRNGNPVMAGACLVTCSTDLHIVNLDDTGTTTIITLSDGSTVTSPEIDKDDFVKTSVISVVGGVNHLILTMESGAVHDVVLPSSPTPTVTDLTNTPDYNAGTIQVNSSDGADTILDICSPYFWPSAWVRSGEFPTEGTSGTKPPSIAVLQDELAGGFAYDANGELVVPKTGRYDVHFLVASIAAETKLYVGAQQLNIGLTVNGTVIASRQQDDYTGHHKGEESVRPRLPILVLNAGDKISVRTIEETPDNRMVTYDIKVIFISNVS